MKRLILMRHAKSSWAVDGQRDVDRPLNNRGRRNASAMAKWLLGEELIPEVALISAAERTAETWNLMAGSLGDVPASILPKLYLADYETLLQAARSLKSVDTALILAHQPGIGGFARKLLAAPPADSDFQRYPTAAISVLDFAITQWSALNCGKGMLRAFVTPRQPNVSTEPEVSAQVSD